MSFFFFFLPSSLLESLLCHSSVHLKKISKGLGKVHLRSIQPLRSLSRLIPSSDSADDTTLACFSFSSVQFSSVLWPIVCVVGFAMRDDSAEIPFQSFLWEAILNNSGRSGDIHTLTLSSISSPVSADGTISVCFS